MVISAERVLIVEDSATMRAFVIAALETAGLAAVTARSGLEALKLLPKERFRLIITDINMPDINGLELARLVRERAGQEDTPLILMSTERLDPRRCRAAGARHCLKKPFSPEELLSAVRSCLA